MRPSILNQARALLFGQYGRAVGLYAGNTHTVAVLVQQIGLQFELQAHARWDTQPGTSGFEARSCATIVDWFGSRRSRVQPIVCTNAAAGTIRIDAEDNDDGVDLSLGDSEWIDDQDGVQHTSFGRTVLTVTEVLDNVEQATITDANYTGILVLDVAFLIETLLPDVGHKLDRLTVRGEANELTLEFDESRPYSATLASMGGSTPDSPIDIADSTAESRLREALGVSATDDEVLLAAAVSAASGLLTVGSGQRTSRLNLSTRVNKNHGATSLARSAFIASATRLAVATTAPLLVVALTHAGLANYKQGIDTNERQARLVVAEKDTLESSIRELRHELRAAGTIVSSRTWTAKMLAEMAGSVSDRVWLYRTTISSDGNSAEHLVRVQGFAESADDVRLMIASLETNGEFSRIRLDRIGSLSITNRRRFESSKHAGVEFELTAREKSRIPQRGLYARERGRDDGESR